MRWFYEHLLAVPDPPTASMALDAAIRVALLTNFGYRHYAHHLHRFYNCDWMVS